MIEILLGLSVLLNVIFIWYLVKLLKRFLNVSDELENLFVFLEDYANQIESVYKLERFYGDATLENLMRHSKSVTDLAKNFRSTYDVEYEFPEDEEYYDEEE